jgi:hypothetical protein
MDREGKNDPNSMLRSLQIMVAVLIMGLVIFSAVAAGLVLSGSMPPPGGPGPAAAPVFLTVMGVLTLVTLAASFVMRGVIVAGARKKFETGEIPEDGVIPQYQVATVLRAALAEGPALFGAVIVMITGNWLGFAGTAFGLLMLLVVFPTRDRRDGFVRDVTGRGPSL